MLHLANTDGCQGPASQACPLQVAPRPSEPTLNGPSCCLHGLSSNDMPRILRNSIDCFLCQSNGRRAVELQLLLGADNGREGKVLKMIVSLLGLSVELCGLNHIIIRKWSRADPLFYPRSTRHYTVAMSCYPGQTWGNKKVIRKKKSTKKCKKVKNNSYWKENQGTINKFSSVHIHIKTVH